MSIIYRQSLKRYCERGRSLVRTELNLGQLVELFQRDKSVISRHLNNVFKVEEVKKEATVAKIATVQNEGGRKVERKIENFNLDVIISIGYRIKSPRSAQVQPES